MMRLDVVSPAPQASAAQAGAMQQAMRAQIANPEESEVVTSTAEVSQVQMRSQVAAEEDSTPVFTAEDIEKLVKQGNTLFKELRLHEQFQLVKHEKLDRTMIRLVDTQQDRVIREFPPKKYLDLVAALHELTGLFFDERV